VLTSARLVAVLRCVAGDGVIWIWVVDKGRLGCILAGKGGTGEGENLWDGQGSRAGEEHRDRSGHLHPSRTRGRSAVWLLCSHISQSRCVGSRRASVVGLSVKAILLDDTARSVTSRVGHVESITTCTSWTTPGSFPGNCGIWESEDGELVGMRE
jgi:hypothetical protein